MKKIIACSFVSLCMLLGTVIFTLAAGNTGPADITLDEGGKKPAQFTHKNHQDRLKCGECHHQMTADGKQSPYVEGQEIKKCVTCHNSTVLAGRMKDKLALDVPNVRILPVKGEPKSLLQLPQKELDDLRAWLLRPFKITFRAPNRVALYLFKDGSWVVENFNDQPAAVELNGQPLNIESRGWMQHWN